MQIIWVCGEDSETHHFGHRAQVRVQIGMEGSVIVVDGAIGVFQSVAREHANHRGSCRYFVFARMCDLQPRNCCMSISCMSMCTLAGLRS